MYKWIVLLLIFSSCTAKWYETKFYKKGGKFECEPRIISRIDTLVTESGDTVFNTIYKTVYEPKVEYRTKWQYRFDIKRLNDSLDFIKGMYRDSLKFGLRSQKSTDRKDIKQSKHQQKTNRTQIRKENKNKWWYWLIIGMPIGVAIYKAFGFLIKRIKL